MLFSPLFTFLFCHLINNILFFGIPDHCIDLFTIIIDCIFDPFGNTPFEVFLHPLGDLGRRCIRWGTLGTFTIRHM